MSGFIIKELKLTSDQLPPASVEFKSGLNVISGPSNCGKSYIFECINYMLGGSTPPKKIDEAKLYDEAILEILASPNEAYTLVSNLTGGNFKLFECSIEEIESQDSFLKLSRRHNPSSDKTISAFLLKLNGLYEKKIRTNQQGKVRKLSYRDLNRFSLINEVRILTADSVIDSHYTKRTEETNVFKLIISGKDDSNVIAVLDKNKVNNRKGQIEILDKLIMEINNELSNKGANVTIPVLEDSIKKLDLSFGELNKSYEDLKGSYSALEKKRSKSQSYLDEKEKRYAVIMELHKRSGILKEQYNTDIQRLKSTIETSILLKDNEGHTYKQNCPLCNNEMLETCSAEDLRKIINSCEVEIKKITSLLSELKRSELLINEEIQDLKTSISEARKRVDDLTEQLSNGIGKEIDEIINKIQLINIKRNKHYHLLKLRERLESLTNNKELVSNSIPNRGDKANYDELSEYSLNSFCSSYLKVLNGINMPNIETVKYNAEKNDFKFNNKNRGLSGKGVRAITYASFIVAVHEHVATQNYSIGIPTLDSPLVTFKKAESKKDGISLDLAMDFYRYLSKNKKLRQSIIIENELPPNDISSKINHIKFGSKSGASRYGFIPTSSESQTQLF